MEVKAVTEKVIINTPSKLPPKLTVAPVAFGWTSIRDEIVIDKALHDKIVATVKKGDTVGLIARSIVHAAKFVLALPGINLYLIAEEYDANGGSINLSDVTPGKAGSRGKEGARAPASKDGSKPGGIGAAGGIGGTGQAGSTLYLICERLKSANLITNGAPGGIGGDGGKGGDGQEPRRLGNTDIESPGSGGGNGGPAGVGGTGGQGGKIEAYYTSAATPLALKTSVKGGGGGGPGQPGAAGAASDDKHKSGSPGATSHAGVAGADGKVINQQLTASEYWSQVQTLLGKVANDWAAYRTLVGEYDYRVYKPSEVVPAGKSSFLAKASNEFKAALNLQPGHADANRYQQQILLNQTVLGKSRSLDIIPKFDEYSTKYSQWQPLVNAAFNSGITLLLNGDAKAVNEAIYSNLIQQIQSRTEFLTLDVSAAQAVKEAAKKDLEYLTGKMEALKVQIKAAEEALKHQTVSAGAIIGTLAEIATAVVGVVAAIPTGGASLIAVVPSVIALTATAAETIPAIAKAFMEPSAPEVASILKEADKVSTAAQKAPGNKPLTDKEKLSKAVDQVGTNVKNIKGLVVGVISLVTAAQKLSALLENNKDNSASLALLRQASELAHEIFLANLRQTQADFTLQAREKQLSNDQALLAIAKAQLEQVKSAEVLKSIGRTAILSTQRHIDLLNNVLFKAERSLEIYTLQSADKFVSFDSGHVHPDIDQKYVLNEINTTQLVKSYLDSWNEKTLSPLVMENIYADYFEAQGSNFSLTQSLVFRSFKDPVQINAFKNQRTFYFNIDLKDLPAHEFEIKIDSVRVALIGASVPGNAPLSCTVRRGATYLQKTRENKEHVTLLRPNKTQVTALTQAMSEGSFSSGAVNDPKNAPSTLAFWGLGVAGTWTIEIEAGVAVNLNAVTEIQIAIATVAFI